MLTFRFADINDVMLYYNWANDSVARKNSYNKGEIKYADHVNWFTNRLNSKLCFFYLFVNGDNTPVGQVRIEKKDNKFLKEAVISISVDAHFRGKKLGEEMLKLATDAFLEQNIGYQVIAYVFSNNLASYKSFINAGYNLVGEKMVNGIASYILKKTN